MWSLIAALALTAGVGPMGAAEKLPVEATVADLAFLAGTWRGVSSTGWAAEEMISEPRGGVMLATAREFVEGRCVFFDLVVFADREGRVVLLPHPNGKRSPHDFPLVALDGAARRVEFRNAANDFPQTFVYQVDGDGGLRITLSGEGHAETYTLRRVERGE